MGRIVVMNHVTLDGVMQGPGRSDEDPRGGFTQSGWGGRSGDANEIQQAMSRRMEAGGGLAGWLFGRTTYEDLLSYWNGPQAVSPEFGPMLSNAQNNLMLAMLRGGMLRGPSHAAMPFQPCMPGAAWGAGGLMQPPWGMGSPWGPWGPGMRCGPGPPCRCGTRPCRCRSQRAA